MQWNSQKPQIVTEREKPGLPAAYTYVHMWNVVVQRMAPANGNPFIAL